MSVAPADTQQRNARARSRSRWAGIAAYAAMVAVMYVYSTPTTTANFSENERKKFKVAAMRLSPAAGESRFLGVSLADIDSKKVDPASVSFLLPAGPIDIRQGDLHEVVVLERHPDSQLVEYRYANTVNSDSRYRAYRDRVEPVSYRVTMHPGIFILAFVLVIPAALVQWLVRQALSRRVP
jgi:hypothetical protein